METDPAQEFYSAEKLHLLQGVKEVIADQRRMVNNSTFCDIVFVCNDGKLVQALRKLVAGRSEVLKSLLLNGMAETRQSEIELPEISSRALLSVLEFLYTGILLDYGPKSWTIGCELILASCFFILPILENYLRMFMNEQISNVAEDKTKAASLLTEALRYGMSGKKDVVLAELVRILSSDWSTSAYVHCLSEDAFHYLLANSKGKLEDDGTLSLREYYRFMQVILWWFYKSDLGSRAKKKLVNFIPAAERTAISLFIDRDNVGRGESPRDAPTRFNDFILAQLRHLTLFDNIGREETPPKDAPTPFNDLTLSQLHGASKNSVKRLLSNIDFRRIHPILLSKVVEPLNLLSAAEILNSFRFHALHRDIVFSLKAKYVWDHAENCISFKRGLGIQKAARKFGLAIMKEALDTYSRWRFEFQSEEVCEDFVELGLFSYSSDVGAERPEFNGKRLANQDHSLVLKFQGTQLFLKSAHSQGGVWWTTLEPRPSIDEVKGTGVIISYNGSQRNCSLSIITAKYGISTRRTCRSI